MPFEGKPSIYIRPRDGTINEKFKISSSHEVSMFERMNSDMVWNHSRQDKHREGNNGKSP
jgi:hypothetical protein